MKHQRPIARPFRAAVLTVTAAAFTACVGSDPPGLAPGPVPTPDASTSEDAGADVSCGDTSSDPANCGACGQKCAEGASCSKGACYNEVSAVSNWKAFDVGTSFGEKSFGGAVTVDEYVYFVPASTGIVSRYDTRGAFDVRESWAAFDVATRNASAKVFRGAVKVGNFLYLVPQEYSVIVQYDTSKPFNDKESWTTFDFSAAVGSGGVYFGGAADDRYLYLVPYATAQHAGPTGRIVQYDTQKPLTEAGSWSSYALGGALGENARGFFGAVVAKRYLYLVPYAAASWVGLVVQHDMQSGLSTSWASFDLPSQVKAGAVGYAGGVFDGQYVYLAPYMSAATTSHGLAVRFDTLKPFNQPASWGTYDLTAVNANAKGFVGGEFDGRYVYFTPSGSQLVRRDTLAPAFDDRASWSSFDTTTVHAGAKGFLGTAFDGKNLYFAPGGSGIALRFEARSPASRPVERASYL